MCLWASYEKKRHKKIFVLHPENQLRKESDPELDSDSEQDPEPDPDPLVRGMVPVPHQIAPDPNTGFKSTMKNLP
jgi:hypothetical protein